MSRKIVVSSNCQTGGLAASLAAMLPDDNVAACPWIGADASDAELRQSLIDADAWVTAADAASIDALVPNRNLRVLRVPRVLFGAFHPDTVYAAGPDGAWIASPVARMHSAIVLWGWRNGLSADDIVQLFTPQALHALGYTSAWRASVDRLRADFDATDVAFDAFFLPLQRREAFMLTVNHARICALVEVARQIASQLGADAASIDYPWETTLPDRPAMFGPVWPVYPAVAEQLGLRGGFVWRNLDGRLLRLHDFVVQSLERYGDYAVTDITVPALDDPRFDLVLGRGTS